MSQVLYGVAKCIILSEHTQFIHVSVTGVLTSMESHYGRRYCVVCWLGLSMCAVYGPLQTPEIIAQHIYRYGGSMYVIIQYRYICRAMIYCTIILDYTQPR